MKIGLLLPTALAQLGAGVTSTMIVRTAIELENAGLDSIWVGDSMSRPRLEPLTLLAGIATATHRITLGTALLIPAYRHPVHAAVTLASLDRLAPGRLVVGVGAGFPGLSEKEFEMVGVAMRTGFSWLDDNIRLWREMWAGAATSYHGRRLGFPWLPEVPPPATRGGPPIWLGGISPSALARTASLYDGWMPYPPDPSTFRNALSEIEVLAQGRAVTPSTFATVHVDQDHRVAAAAVEDYCRATYGLPAEQVGQIQALIVGGVDDVGAALGEYLEAGAEHLVLRIAATEPHTFEVQLERVLAVTREIRSASVVRAGRSSGTGLEGYRNIQVEAQRGRDSMVGYVPVARSNQS